MLKGVKDFIGGEGERMVEGGGTIIWNFLKIGSGWPYLFWMWGNARGDKWWNVVFRKVKRGIQKSFI